MGSTGVVVVVVVVVIVEVVVFSCFMYTWLFLILKCFLLGRTESQQ